KSLLNPFEYGFVSFQLISHKILRWLMPFFMIILLVCNLILLEIPVYRFIFLLQVLFYVSVPLAWVMHRYGKKVKFLFLPLYFCIVNLASVLAIINIIKGTKMATWETVRK
ncbi:MAG: glycosyltransferase family 2 protein, partial [Candidatus Hodarchaeota archaeon]